ncbi:MAG: hypothetical protein ACJA1O_001324 [Spirosomataceae bacterium]|jgi:hypothetical protein
MKKLLIFSLVFSSVLAFGQDINMQIEQAIKAAPEEDKADAIVMGYNDSNELIIIRQGTNKMICLSDNPQKPGFDAACYHEDLEPFMARGRELKLAGKSFQEIFDIREVEAKSGELKMPAKPVTLHILNGKTEAEASYRWVVYIPFATAESTGLPLKPIVPGAPWIMNPGTHRAHIMISPEN